MERPVDVAVPVVIVGAGPTGVTAALLLADYGVRCLVLDRWDGVYPQPRAVHLDDEVCRILGRIGVAKGFAAISRPGLGLRLVDRDLHVLTEFRRSGAGGRHGFPQANMFDQPDLEKLLREELATRPTVTLRGNCVVTAVRQRADHAEVDFTDGVTGAAETVRTRYVLGCDGANSLVRAQMGSTMKSLGFEQRWLVIDVQTDAELGHWDGVHQVCDPVRAATYMRVAGTRHRWEFRMLPDETLAGFATPGAVHDLIRPWTAGVPDDRLDLVRTAVYTFRAEVADRWRDRRVFLLGDAAHLTPPFIGQGLGAGLRDAANLSWKLAGVLQGGLDDDCLDSYQTERKAHATALIRLAVRLGIAMTGGGRTADRVRRTIVPRLHLVPGIRARAVDSATPRLVRSALARRSVRSPFVGGLLCPNAVLDDGTRLDDVRAAYVVLALDDVARGEIESKGGAVVQVRPRSALGRWLRRHGVRAAVVRPDGAVLVGGRCAADILPTPAGLPPTGINPPDDGDRMTSPGATDLLWPHLDSPDQLSAVEAVPLTDRNLPASTYSVLERRAELTPDRPVVTFLPEGGRYQEGTTWTAAELLAQVRRYANALVDLGVPAGSAVGLLSTNCSQLLAALLATETVAMAAPLNPGLAPERLASLLRASGARVLVAAGPELHDQVWATAIQLAREGVVDTLLALRPDLPVDQPDQPDHPDRPELPSLPGVAVAYLEDVAASAPSDRLLRPAPAADDLASCFHTGGTTGAPKLAAHTHRNEVVVAWGLATSRSIPDDAVVLAGLPLFHVNALMVTVLAPLMHGQRVLWTGPLGYRDLTLYQNFWRIVAHHRVAAMSAVPTVYAVLAQIPVDADISSLQAAAVGAAPLSSQVRTAFEEHTGVPLIEGYGLTEAGCASVRTLPGHGKPGSVGQRMPYQQVKAVAVDQTTDAWTDLPVGEVGHLVIGGPAVFPGYLRPGPDGPVPDPSGHVRDGWLDTGDLGRVDDDGFVFLVGRAKDVIIRGGHNIDPATIEEALLAHPAVTGAAAVGRPDPHAGELPVVYVTVAEAVDVTSLQAWAAERITERAAVPRSVHVVDTLPLTLIGKPEKQSLRRDAVRRVVLGELAELPGESVVEVDSADDGRLVVKVSGLDPELHAQARDRLAAYSFTTVLT